MFDEISRLKRRGRKLLRSIRRAEDGAECGRGLLADISISYATERAEFDTIMARLREIDPTVPPAPEKEGTGQ